jgi:hypothetical protein
MLGLRGVATWVMRVAAGVVCAVAAWAWARAVAAEAGSVAAPVAGGSNTYEQARLDAFLTQAALEADPRPTGKLIAYVRYERRDVFERDDALLVPLVLPAFAPTWPNHFHWLTEQDTIARELLLHEGEPFEPALAEESMRNLRALGIFSLVRIVAVKSADPGRVGVLVYTRDLWSLRTETSFEGTGSTFSLGAAVVERNFLGRNKQLSARVFLDPLTYSVGETYYDPRMLGAPLRLYETLDVIVNRETGEPEGSTGTLRWGRPFYDLAQERSFDLVAYYADYVYRDAPSGVVTGFDARPGETHGDACTPGAPQCIARAWDDRFVRFEGAFHERVGQRYKQTFSVGAGFEDRSVDANAETLLVPALRDVFRDEVAPRERREVYPFVRYRLSLPRFATFTNLATFGQSETLQVGPQLDARFALPLDEFGSSSDGFVTRGLLGYVWAADDALAELAGRAAARLDEREVVDQEAGLRLRMASPSYRWAFGRFVLRAVWDARRRDSQRTFVSLGGDNGLRGYPSDDFYGFGASSWLGNIEYRTRPIEVRSVQLGLVAFYDAGSVYRRLSQARLHHALGLGLRVLFPQFNRYAFRIDCGAPLEKAGMAVSFSYGSAQAVPLTADEDLLEESSSLLQP